MIAAIKNGDTEVFEEVFHCYHEKLYFYVLSKVHSTYLSEETVQETFVKLWRFRDHLNEDLPISAQLFRIAKSCMVDMLRKQSTQTALKETLPAIADITSPIQDVEYKELKTRIEKAISMLPPMRRKVFEMSRVQGMNYRQIAAELSLSEKTVENHISHALKQLRKWIPAYILIIFFPGH